VKFYCGKAETLLPSIIGQFDRNDVVAVVDPPRAGLRMFISTLKMFWFACDENWLREVCRVQNSYLIF